MHLPNGALCPYTCLTTAAISAGILGVAVRRLQRDADRPSAAALGAVAASVLAAQAFNFPIAEGASGHVLGGLAAACAVGPWAGMLVTAAVLAIQSACLNDGGLTTLGANILNMSLIGCGLGYALFVVLRRRLPGAVGVGVSAAIAGWTSVMLAATACSVELATERSGSLLHVLSTIGSAHLVIGLVEGAVTAAVVAMLAALRGGPATSPIALRIVGLALLLLVVTSPASSPLPDALESSLQKLAIADDGSSAPAAADVSNQR